jgi:hypothetical protein
MKPSPPPHVPGNTEAERMDNAVCRMFSVSKEDIVKAEEQWKRQHQSRKKRAKKPH